MSISYQWNLAARSHALQISRGCVCSHRGVDNFWILLSFVCVFMYWWSSIWMISMHHWKVSFTQLPSNPICKNHRVITSIMYRISQPTTTSTTRAVTLSEHVSSFITKGNTHRLKNGDVMMILFPSRIVHSESDRDLKIEAESRKCLVDLNKTSWLN